MKSSFGELVRCYAGNGGLLDIHRKKAFGYTKMGMLSGRKITNSK